MNRHTRLDRLASGVLFSPPADWTTAVPDIPRHKKRNKAPQLGHTPQDNVAGVQQMCASFAQTRGPGPSVFPYFLDATATRRHTDTESGLADDDSVVLRPTPSKQSPTLCLPILSISVDVTIDGMISYTKLTQSFLNPSEQAIPEARHTFPLYDGAVITSFECEIGDVRRLQGVVKPKAQAKHAFEKAKANKREAAALLEELTPDIFETSLGNIPAKTKVDITLTYVHELKVVTSREEKAEGLAITIPTSLAPRYGASKVSIPSTEAPSEGLEITVKVLDNGTIDPAASHVESDHDATYEGLQPVRNVVIASISELHHNNSEARTESPTQHVWHYSSKSQPFLKRDFILVAVMHKETRLHSRAVVTAPNEAGHVALMVSLRPNDIFGSAVRPESFSGEILFILDRSDSMGWPASGEVEFKMNTMKRAMLLALAGLPPTCTFNIISFGSEVRGMWAKSGKYNQSNLSHAREYISTIEADMGGTEVLLALKCALKTRMRTSPSTQVILVTDGEVDTEPHDAILDCVWKSRQDLGDQVRFFTLGIGDNVSHSIIESIAELGGGYCDVVDLIKSHRWESRFNRMLRSVMEPDRWNCDISLGPGFERRSLADHDFGAAHRHITTTTVYTQGPHPIPALHPFRYKSVFFLLDLKATAALPKKVTITTTTEAAKKKQYDILVEPARLQEGTLHHLTAKMVLLSLEDEVKRKKVDSGRARTNGETLAMSYNVSSEWTSFVAIANENEQQTQQMEIYKSLYLKTDLQDLLDSESEESATDSEENEVERELSDRQFPRRNSLRHQYSNRSRIGFFSGKPQDSFGRPESNTAMASTYSRDAGPESHEEVSLSSRPVSHGAAASGKWACIDQIEREYKPRNNLPIQPTICSSELERHDVVSEHAESTYHETSRNGFISWEDVIECVDSGLFMISHVLRAQLYSHFCGQTVERLMETLRLLPKTAQKDERSLAVLVDTLMMVQYFKTHLAVEEENWNLIIGKAERTVLLALGHEEDQEAALEPLYEMLLSAIFHTHLPEAMDHASAEEDGTEESVGPSSIKTCLMCDTVIEVTAGKAFVCLSYVCPDNQTLSRTRYNSWAEFWEHQVQSGHLLCPKAEEGFKARPSKRGYFKTLRHRLRRFLARMQSS